MGSSPIISSRFQCQARFSVCSGDEAGTGMLLEGGYNVSFGPQPVSYAAHRSGSNSVVESQPSKLLVAGSIPVSRSRAWPRAGSRRPAARTIVLQQEITGLGSTYQQATIPIADPARFGSVRDTIIASFSPAGVAEFLGSLDRDGLRIRDFELVLGEGCLGKAWRTSTAG